MDSSVRADGTILVTGGSGLTGRALATPLARRGQAIVGLDRQRPADPPRAVLLQ